MEQNTQDFYADGMGEIIFIAVVLFLVIIIIRSVFAFKSERDYIKMEIERSTKKEELSYWREELRKFYLRKIPIIGDLLLTEDEYEDDYEFYDQNKK